MILIERDIPLNLFLEGGAGLRLTPDIKFTGSGALGIRYIFSERCMKKTGTETIHQHILNP